MTSRHATLLLVEGDLGRRATLPVALRTGYLVTPASSVEEAFHAAAVAAFDVAVLDAGVFGATFPRFVRLLRARRASVRLVVLVSARDFRARHYATMLACDAVLHRTAKAHVVLDRVDAPVRRGVRRPRFDRSVGRAIDLMARDAMHLSDPSRLAKATGVALPQLGARFRMMTGLSVREYAARVRVAVAQQFVKDGGIGMAALAELLGFASADELTALVPTAR
jgi:DNA-binding NarL/FixJ family response regulator